MRFLTPLGLRPAFIRWVVASFVVARLVGAPALAAQAVPSAQPDPFEGFNRGSFNVTDALDRALLRPLAVGFQRIAPRPLRAGLRNAFSNLGEPVVALNDVFQGHLPTAARTAIRFTANSTVGVLGLIDVAKALQLPHHDNGFGLTLGRFGAPAGPYLFVPLLGPSTVRDGFGRVVDAASDPLNYAQFNSADALRISRYTLTALDERAESDQRLKDIRSTATDPYATLRSIYLQSREAQIRGDNLHDETLPDFSDPVAEGVPATATAPK
jgi:phospholipid-binding lipoprotein MlaA